MQGAWGRYTRVLKSSRKMDRYFLWVVGLGKEKESYSGLHMCVEILELYDIYIIAYSFMCTLSIQLRH